MNQVYLKVCPVKPEYQDEDWNYIVFEFSMNFTVDSVRSAYWKSKEEQNKFVDKEMLRELGYNDEDILNSL